VRGNSPDIDDLIEDRLEAGSHLDPPRRTELSTTADARVAAIVNPLPLSRPDSRTIAPVRQLHPKTDADRQIGAVDATDIESPSGSPRTDPPPIEF
jgi:hypothetical protein